jgi:lysozyme
MAKKLTSTLKNSFRTGPEGLALIKRWEGLMLNAYTCSAGVWTIGYGHTAKAGPPDVKKGDVITKEAAEEILKADLVKFEDVVNRAVKSSISQEQFDALVSFTYNLGPGNFQASTLLKLINNNEFGAAADEFIKWNKAGGKELPGLTKRRLAEKELYLKGTICKP